MSLLKQIEQDMIKALKAGDRDATNTLRGLKSDVKYYQIDKRLQEVSDDDVLVVLGSAAKRRRDSIEQFHAGGREDLVAKETRELEIITGYMPQQMSEAEIEVVVGQTIAETEAKGPADLGRLMKELMPKVKGKADGKLVNQVAKRLLTS